MKIQLAVATALVFVLMSGCGKEELENKIAQLEAEKKSLQSNIDEREKFMGEVVLAVEEVYKDVEAVRVKEAKLVQKAGGPEAGKVTNVDTRKELLTNIGEIGSKLKENQTRIANLEAKAKKLGVQIAALNKVIATLKQTITDRESSIAALETKVTGLESTVAEKSRLITERETMISEQQKAMNTGYYIVGTRSELREKGIINKEGGFLWGLLGSTTTLGTEVDKSLFTPIDMTKEETITVEGAVDELIPSRKQEQYGLTQTGTTSSLAIKDPARFWQQKYLVIVLD